VAPAAEDSRRLGVVRELRRFPVKGMAGEQLDSAFLSFAGIVGDRVYAFRQTETPSPAERPWLTARIWRPMLLQRPRFLAASAIAERAGQSAYPLQVTTAEGDTLDVADPRLREYLEGGSGRELRLRFSERSMHDSRPISIFSVATLAALAEETRRKLDARRFRANLLVDWNGGGPLREEALIGCRLRVGKKAELLLVKKDRRCVVVTLEPDSAQAAPEVLENIWTRHGGCAGVYAAVLREGVVERGDGIFALGHEPVHAASQTERKNKIGI
jgi:uncharacterized protein